MEEFDVEDAVSTAIVDLVDYWVTLGSSVSDDTERNFAYAVTRGTWKAKDVIANRSRELEDEQSLENLEGIEADGEEYIGIIAVEPFGDYATARPPAYRSPSAEDVLMESLSHDEILDAIHDLDAEDVDDWFADFWSGDTIVDIADRRSMGASAVRQRRDRGLARLADRCA